MAKSVFVTYLLWSFGGWLGLHHFYLGRDKQAFLWWSLVGGYGGVGLILDFFRIPRYVQEANHDENYVATFNEYVKLNPKPPFSLYRFLGQLVFGNLLAWVTYAAIPVEKIFGISVWWLIVLVPLASAIGVYTVGNVGREEGSIRNALIGAYIPLIFYTMPSPKYYWSSVLAALAFRSQVKWKITAPKKKGVCRRVTRLAAWGCIYLSLWSSYLYFNMVITNEHGETIKFRDSVKNLLRSPMVMEIRESCYILWQYYKLHGISSIWDQIISRFDPLGERNALDVLGVPQGATQEQLTQRWRQLSRQWHPDKFRDPEEKAVAQEKFMEIKEAYDKLSVIHSKRKRKNQRSRAGDQQQETQNTRTEL